MTMPVFLPAPMRYRLPVEPAGLGPCPHCGAHQWLVGLVDYRCAACGYRHGGHLRRVGVNRRQERRIEGPRGRHATSAPGAQRRRLHEEATGEGTKLCQEAPVSLAYRRCAASPGSRKWIFSMMIGVLFLHSRAGVIATRRCRCGIRSTAHGRTREVHECHVAVVSASIPTGRSLTRC